MKNIYFNKKAVFLIAGLLLGCSCVSLADTGACVMKVHKKIYIDSSTFMVDEQKVCFDLSDQGCRDAQLKMSYSNEYLSVYIIGWQRGIACPPF